MKSRLMVKIGRGASHWTGLDWTLLSPSGSMSDDSNQHDDEKERDVQPLPRLPLHPRKAQELFFELLQSSAPGSQAPETDHRTQSLQQRIAGMQTEYEASLKLLKRGIWVRTCSNALEPTDDSLLIQLRLSSDGARLQFSHLVGAKSTVETIEEDADVELELLEEVAMTAIESFNILPASGFFTLQHASDTVAATLLCSPFEAESESVLKQCGLAISGTAHALKTLTDGASKTEQLLWQAIRLRIVELSASTGSLREAISTLEAAYKRIRDRETETDLPDHASLFVLRCG